MLSVVIPTHNRAGSVCQLARALAAERDFEAVFALDSCTDGTREALAALDLPFPLKIVECAGGAAHARNAGAKAARSERLVFIDDDVMPEPGMLAHHAGEGAIVGPYPYAPEMPVNALDFTIREWWTRRFAEMASPEHEFDYRDCLSGNLSIGRDEFFGVGGFDEDFVKDGREDYELGARVVGHLSFRFEPKAAARHYPTNRPASHLRKWYTFGRADVRFAEKHPHLAGTLPLARVRVRRAPGRWVVPLFGRFFEANLERMWSPAWMRAWHAARNLVYVSGALSAGFVPERTCPTLRIEDVEPGGERWIAGERTDRLVVAIRTEGRIAGFADFSGSYAVSPEEIDEAAARFSEEDAPKLPGARVVAVGGKNNLRRKIASVLETCDDEFFLLVSPMDSPDPGWRAALAHFDDPRVACVLLPAVCRSVRTEAEWAQNENLPRVTSWGPTDVTQWMSPGRILREFPAASHRLAVRRELLEGARIPSGLTGIEGLGAYLLWEAIRTWRGAVYDPKALVWAQPGGGEQVYRVLAKTPTARVRAAKAAFHLFASGMWRGILDKGEPECDAPVTVEEKEGRVWVS
ncbi:MAG: glycosyltransferase family 2 protein [Armatimonadota bacterium]